MMLLIHGFWFVTSLALATPSFGSEVAVKDPEGNVVAMIYDCSSCKEPTGTCETGVEAGFHSGAPCGKCLIDANFRKPIQSHYDIHMFGKLTDENGQPLEGRFVRMFLSTGWTIRTRTTNDGTFVLRLGATLKRKSPPPATVQLGTRVMRKENTAPYYALYMLPPEFASCPAEEEQKASKPAPEKRRN